jgi:hypothetical protein
MIRYVSLLPILVPPLIETEYIFLHVSYESYIKTAASKIGCPIIVNTTLSRPVLRSERDREDIKWDWFATKLDYMASFKPYGRAKVFIYCRLRREWG